MINTTPIKNDSTICFQLVTDRLLLNDSDNLFFMIRMVVALFPYNYFSFMGVSSGIFVVICT